MNSKKLSPQEREAFCHAYWKTLDPLAAAEAIGLSDHLIPLEDIAVQKRLQRERLAWGKSFCKEDVLRKLAQLAFSSSEDAIALALGSPHQSDIELSAVTEFKRSNTGAIEVKLIDRVKALQTLYELLDSQVKPSESLTQFFRSLEEEA